MTTIPKRLAIISLIILSIVLIATITLFFMADSVIIQRLLNDYTHSPETSASALKDLLRPLMFLNFIPWLLNILGILYLKRYVMASAVMFIVGGLMMLYTLIIPALLVTAGTMLIIHIRHYNTHEKYKTRY